MVDSPPDPSLGDFELLPNPEGPIPPRRERYAVWLAVALIAAVAVAAYFVITTRRQAPASQPAATTSRPATTTAPEQPLGADVAPIDLPPLAQTDPIVRELVGKLTSNPQVAAWLATKDLIRNFVVVVSNVADGRSPAPQLRVLRPSAAFHVVDRNGVLSIDPRSYERYNRLADAVASVDPAGAARLYTTLKPRIEDAYRELGFPDTPFDRTLERAFVVLLGAPVVNDPVRVVPVGGRYHFAAMDVERLSPAQRQLVRTGPRNERLIQSSLRQIAVALGIAPGRLPAERQ